MCVLQAFIDAPTPEGDVDVGQVISGNMFMELMKEMKEAGVDEKQLDEVKKRWKEEYMARKVISGFVKDKTIGSKRLASMPDRVTNTINTEGGSTALRPTVVNCFQGEMGDMKVWWQEWRHFMFHTKISLVGAKSQTKVFPRTHMPFHPKHGISTCPLSRTIHLRPP